MSTMSKHLPARALALGAALVLGASALTGCTRWMRDPEFYSDELTELLESRSEAIEACYDRYLAEVDPEAKGELVVDFIVEKQTGAIRELTIDAAKTTVPEGLAACATEEIAALRLEPVDARTAEARFTYEFARGSKKKPPADPFAEVEGAVLACYSAHLAEVDREATGELVVDYAMNQERGTVDELVVVAAETTAPEALVSCATAALATARLAPGKLDARNLAGRRSFAFRYTPYVEDAP